MRKKIHILVFALFLTVYSSHAQEIRWSNYYAAMPTINAASTGAFAGDYRLIGGYRMSQYSAADPFTTIYASYDQGINKHNKDRSAKNTFFAAGLSFMNDNAGLGALTTTEVSGLVGPLPINLAKLGKHCSNCDLLNRCASGASTLPEELSRSMPLLQ